MPHWRMTIPPDRQMKPLNYAAINRNAHLLSALLQLKSIFVPLACKCMVASCSARSHNWLITPAHIEICFVSPGTEVFAHIKLLISSGHLMSWLDTICKLLFNGAFLHQIFFIHTLQLSDAFCKCIFLSPCNAMLLYNDDQMP